MKKTCMVILAALFLAGCAGMSTTEQRVLSGGAIGAGGGALIGAAAGSAAIGAGVGGGAGLLGGYLYDQYRKSHEAPHYRQTATTKKPQPKKRTKRAPAKETPEKETPPETAPPRAM